MDHVDTSPESPPDPDHGTAHPARIGRRRWLAYAGAALGGAALGAGGVGGAVALGDDDSGGGAASTAEDTEELPPVRTYVSTQLVAPDVEVESFGAGPSEGLLFTGGRVDTFRGAVYDNEGEPVWIEPYGRPVAGLRVQRYRGEPVLTYWAGTVGLGFGWGQGVLLDRSYRQVGTVDAGHGVQADLHEFELTDRGTALLTAYPTHRADVSSLGAPTDGWMLDNHLQEIDVETGEVLLDWVASEHLDLDESNQRAGGARPGDTPEGAIDPFHLNSAQARGDAVLLSFRHTDALVLIDRRTGEIRWRLGGTASDFEVPDECGFRYQHDARFLDGGEDGTSTTGRLSIFDNNGNGSEGSGTSSALFLDVDEKGRSVSLVRRLEDGQKTQAMGSTQQLAGGNVVVDWGTAPVISEITPDGDVVWRMTRLGSGSYRGLRQTWTARPTTTPDVAAVTDGGSMTVYASWNGATEVARWRALAGDRRDALVRAEEAERSGFETSLEVEAARYLAVVALDAEGQELGRSRTITVR
ncbi:arylsulfotransferase family protein [Nocardioides acrostichi]|uniref:Arylsulfotransferase family protein n=1 Tax=Nocardioides acrostichi TaxID=2784339 RepID=A0A930YB57_9ACTN|nr:arylsulfotransferase family protein [Nocardioides acrostichi]MBF4162113.1 arylsulfotransferase family protein [Nocardioides acrostichi]